MFDGTSPGFDCFVGNSNTMVEASYAEKHYVLLIDDTTAANRAANIPEFVNISKGGLQRIDAPATEFYRLFNVALEMMKNNRFGEAIPSVAQSPRLGFRR